MSDKATELSEAKTDRGSGNDELPTACSAEATRQARKRPRQKRPREDEKGSEGDDLESEMTRERMELIGR